MIGGIIIGDEIMRGKREDKHFRKLIELLAARGLKLDWAQYLGDSPALITETLRRSLATPDIVFDKDPAHLWDDLSRMTRGVVASADLLPGQMPALPSQNSTLRAALMADKAYMDRLVQLSDELGSWILEAQGQGHLNAALPPELVLYTLFARACDPVLGVLRASGAHSDAQIVDWLVTTCFKGLAG